MKFILLAACLFVASITWAQTATTTNAPKGTNLLIVRNTTYKKCLQMALEEGMQIDKKDDSLYYFSTVPMARKKGTSDTHIYYVRIKGDSAFISGTWNLNMSLTSGMITMQPTNDPIMVKGWRTGGYIPNFILMDEFAHKLGDSVIYVTK